MMVHSVWGIGGGVSLAFQTKRGCFCVPTPSPSSWGHLNRSLESPEKAARAQGPQYYCC